MNPIPVSPEPMHLHVAGPPGAPTVLLLHAMGTSGWMWEPIVERLNGYRCLVPDLPGHGRSADLPWRSLDDTVDDLADLVAKEVRGERFHVIGLSLGAYLALRLLARRPSRVDRAVVSGVNVLPFPHPRLMRLAGYLMLPLLKRNFVLRAQAKALRIPDHQFERYRLAAQAMSLRAFLRIGNELLDFETNADLSQAVSPTLVLAGEHEQDLILRSVPSIVKALPSSQGYLVPGVGHGWSGEVPELFARTAEAWFKGLGLPAELKPASS